MTVWDVSILLERLAALKEEKKTTKRFKAAGGNAKDTTPQGGDEHKGFLPEEDDEFSSNMLT